MTENELHNLELHVKDFGPIAEAKYIEIKPMTVFVGPSNTGKSYLAILLHAMSQALHTASDPGSPLEKSSLENTDHYDRYDDEYKSLVDYIIDSFLGKTDQTDFIELSHDELDPYSQLLISRIEQDTNDRLVDSLDNSVLSFFEESEFCKLSTNGYGELDIELTSHIPNWIFICGGDLGFHAVPRDEFSDNHVHKISQLVLLSPYVARRILSSEYANSSVSGDKLPLIDKINIRSHFQSGYLDIYKNIPKSTYFPSSRTGVIAAHRLLTRSIIKEYQENSRNRIILDFLDHLLAIGGNIRDRDPKPIQVAEILEQSLVSGQIKVQHNQYGLLEFTYSTDDIDIPISRSSAMVTELAPIILFLKGFINIGDLLIIEEPEAHLHPAAQQKMAAALAFMVRSGLRVLITTHSHYMVEQISNFVGASSLSPEKRRELLDLPSPMNEHDVYLDESEVGMYGFDDSSGRTEVKPIPYDDAYAYVPEDHSIALNEQFNRNIRIMRARQNGHNGSINGL